MVTRLYFHNALSELTDLPTTRQGTIPGTLVSNVDAYTVNRTMNGNIGSSFTSKQVTTVASTAHHGFYFTRFVSSPLAAQTIDAETWTYCIAAEASHINANHPVDGADKPCYVYIALWRPGTGIIGAIRDGMSNSDFDEPTTSLNWHNFIGTFSGSSQTTQEGDVLIIEVFNSIIQASALQRITYYGYDGTTVSTTSGAAASDLASFLETPQDLTFVGEGPIEMDVTDTVVLTNKFIDGV